MPCILKQQNLCILTGLAIYNSHILEFSFPLVLYKKLTGVKPTFQDLQVRLCTSRLQTSVGTTLSRSYHLN